MTFIIVFFLKLTAVGILLSGAFVASQQQDIGSSDVLLISIAILVIADLVNTIGGGNGRNRREESSVPEV
jgi:hypothetical protein